VGPPEERKPPGPGEWPKVRRKMMQESLEMLTREQRKKFEKMTGKKFDFELR
jgi:hypothetical protein